MISLSLYEKNIFEKYKSNSQIARVLTENWFNSQMYCPSCLNNSLTSYPNNKKVYDFLCEKCKTDYQLKASSKKFASRVLDGEFNTMIKAIIYNKAPTFFLLNYSQEDWVVKNLSVIPKFFITSSIIEKREPLTHAARRAGWVGCNILLKKIPEEGNIQIIRDEEVIDREEVNKTWREMSFLSLKNPKARGWTTDVLRCVENLNENEFTLQEAYACEDYLCELYPKNKHIKDKIRQQLQILRDNKILEFIGRGKYHLINK